MKFLITDNRKWYKQVVSGVLISFPVLLMLFILIKMYFLYFSYPELFEILIEIATIVIKAIFSTFFIATLLLGVWELWDWAKEENPRPRPNQPSPTKLKKQSLTITQCVSCLGRSQDTIDNILKYKFKCPNCRQ